MAFFMFMFSIRQKAPSAIRCIKTPPQPTLETTWVEDGQKAPSAIRCIKTLLTGTVVASAFLGQKAPSAIRCIKTAAALVEDAETFRQKAPSAIRCIKTE